MVSKIRLVRIKERIREELSEILLLESSDPRLKGITITDVDIDRELAYAEIYVSTIEGSKRSQEILVALDHAQGYLRSELAHRMELRVIPQLRFHWDSTFERADRIEQLLTTIHEMDGGEADRKASKRGVKRDGTRS